METKYRTLTSSEWKSYLQEEHLYKDETIIFIDSGGKNYFRNKVPHREDGPAHGEECYYLNGVSYSKEEHHAVCYKLTTVTTGKIISYIVNGMRHRTDGPSQETETDINWFLNGKRHRVDGPAIIIKDGSRLEWYFEGLHHREDGPAVIVTGEYEVWFQRGKKHRLDGPATQVVPGSGTAKTYSNKWCIDGITYTEQEHMFLTKKQNLKPFL